MYLNFLWRITHQCVVEETFLLRFSSNFEACASKLLENLKEMFHLIKLVEGSGSWKIDCMNVCIALTRLDRVIFSYSGMCSHGMGIKWWKQIHPFFSFINSYKTFSDVSENVFSSLFGENWTSTQGRQQYVTETNT